VASISYPHLSREEISASLEEFYKRFYFRPRKMAEMTLEMVTSATMLKRRLREGAEFARFLRNREGAA
jgi:hypothetical protein